MAATRGALSVRVVRVRSRAIRRKGVAERIRCTHRSTCRAMIGKLSGPRRPVSRGTSVRRCRDHHRHRRHLSGRVKWPPSRVAMAVAGWPARDCRVRDGGGGVPVDRHDMTFCRHARRRRCARTGRWQGAPGTSHASQGSHGISGAVKGCEARTIQGSTAPCGRRFCGVAAGGDRTHRSPAVPRRGAICVSIAPPSRPGGRY